jgi:hypothetical protein
MSYCRVFNPRALRVAVLTLTVFFSDHALPAKDPPADACAMLPAAQLAKVLEQPFGPPSKSKAPAAFRGGSTGTDCSYQTGKGPSRELVFRIYVDASPEVAKDTFNKLSKFFGPSTAVTGDWDTAYLDPVHAIHVLKGKVRYFLNLDPVGTDTAKAEKQLKDLAAWVAGQL